MGINFDPNPVNNTSPNLAATVAASAISSNLSESQILTNLSIVMSLPKPLSLVGVNPPAGTGNGSSGVVSDGVQGNQVVTANLIAQLAPVFRNPA